MRPLRSNRPLENAVNLAIRLAEFVTDGGELWVRGTDVVSNREISVALTTTGQSAQQAKRPKLSAFQSGDGNLVTKPGGIIGFERCYPDKLEGRFRGSWPVFMAGSDDKASLDRVKINQPCTLEVSQRQSDGQRFGFLSVWQPTNVKSFRMYEEALSRVLQWFDFLPKQLPKARPVALVRAENEAGKVVAYARILNKFDTTAKAPESGAQSIAAFKQTTVAADFLQVASERGAVAYGIVPAVNYTISPIWLREQGERVEIIAKQFISVRQAGDVMAKRAAFVLDTKMTFATCVLVNDPYGDSGLDPVLLKETGEQLEYDASCDPASESTPSSQPPASQRTTTHSAPTQSPPFNM